MEFVPDLVAPAESIATLPGRRVYHRQKVSTLAYVNLDHTNGGIIRDLSEGGLAIQAVAPLRLNQQVHLRFDLLRPRLRVETVARVAWADSRGQAGLTLLNLPERSRRLLKQWIFTQLLSRAHHFARTGLSAFVSSRPADAADELLFSATSRPAIHLEPQENHAELEIAPDPSRTLRFPWCPFAISPRALSRLVDGVILSAAVLLFSVLAITLTHVLPAEPIALALALTVTGLFAVLYWFLFEVWIGTTPGEHLAQVAVRDAEANPEEDQPRFR